MERTWITGKFMQKTDLSKNANGIIIYYLPLKTYCVFLWHQEYSGEKYSLLTTKPSMIWSLPTSQTLPNTSLSPSATLVTFFQFLQHLMPFPALVSLYVLLPIP